MTLPSALHYWWWLWPRYSQYIACDRQLLYTATMLTDNAKGLAKLQLKLSHISQEKWPTSSSGEATWHILKIPHIIPILLISMTLSGSIDPYLNSKGFQGIKQFRGAGNLINDLLLESSFLQFLGPLSVRPHQKLQLRLFINFYLINWNFKTSPLSQCTFHGGINRLKVVTEQQTKTKVLSFRQT